MNDPDCVACAAQGGYRGLEAVTEAEIEAEFEAEFVDFEVVDGLDFEVGVEVEVEVGVGVTAGDAIGVGVGSTTEHIEEIASTAVLIR
jgi:hypothetical protein